PPPPHHPPRPPRGHWPPRAPPAALEPHPASSLRTPPGELLLRRILLAAHLAFRQLAPAGLGPLRLFLQFSQLDRFVAPSHGAQHDLAVAVETLLAEFAQQERDRLAAAMTPKTIALVPDEHFHAQSPCLVALEPVSNFILVEQSAADRPAATWADAIRRATAGMALEVVLLSSDQARALLACASDELHAQHLPELFHGQRD